VGINGSYERLPPSSRVKMEAVHSPEILVLNYQTTKWCNKPEDHNMDTKNMTTSCDIIYEVKMVPN